MPIIRTEALVLRSIDVFESSSVLTLFTRDSGKVSALARGARRLRSPFQSGLDLLSFCDIVLIHKASESLALLTEASLIERFPCLSHDIAAFYAGAYVAELLNALTHHLDPHPRLLDAAVVTLRHLDEPPLRPGRLLRFELACLRELGLMPSLQECVHCGLKVNRIGNPVAFSIPAGGVLCPRCRPAHPHAGLLSETALQAIQALASPGPAWRSLAGQPALLHSLRSTLDSIISSHLGRHPRVSPYLGG